MQAEEFKEIPVGSEIQFVYRPGLSPVNLSGRYLGMQDDKVNIRVYRTVNYGKAWGRDDLGRQVLTNYDPGADDPNTYNDQTYDPRRIDSLWLV